MWGSCERSAHRNPARHPGSIQNLLSLTPNCSDVPIAHSVNGNCAANDSNVIGSAPCRLEYSASTFILLPPPLRNQKPRRCQPQKGLARTRSLVVPPCLRGYISATALPADSQVSIPDNGGHPALLIAGSSRVGSPDVTSGYYSRSRLFNIYASTRPSSPSSHGRDSGSEPLGQKRTIVRFFPFLQSPERQKKTGGARVLTLGRPERLLALGDDPPIGLHVLARRLAAGRRRRRRSCHGSC